MTKRFWLGWMTTGLLSLGLITGCSEESTPGGPGAAATTTDGEPVNEDATFTLGLPTGATNIEQGMSEVVSVSVDRGDNFSEDVTISFMPPDGITVEPSEATVRSTDDEVELTIQVAPTVAPGEKIIDVSGQGGSGPAATGQLTIEVTESDDNTTIDPAAPAAPPAAVPVEPSANDADAALPSDDATDPNATIEDPNAASADPVNPEGGEPMPEPQE